MGREDFKRLKLNGLTIEVKDQHTIVIKDKMSNCDEAEAFQICSYLYQEGFIDKDKNVRCEIKR